MVVERDMRVEDKRHRLNQEVHLRQWSERQRGHVPRNFLFATFLLVPLCIGAGMGLVWFNHPSFDSINSGSPTSFKIDGYYIEFVNASENDDIVGNYGFTYDSLDNDIYINKSLLKKEDYRQIRITCNHEKLHNLGLPEKHHDMIDLYEDEIEDPTCNKLVKKIVGY